jgi:hypothetical protein
MPLDTARNIMFLAGTRRSQPMGFAQFLRRLWLSR